MRALPGRPRPARRWAAAAAGVAVATATTGAVAGPAAASAPSVDPAVALTVDGRGLAHVVVVLDDQVPQVSAAAATSARRAGLVAARQAPFLRSVRASGGRVTHTYSVINGFAAEVSPAEAAALAATPGVRSVHPDRPVAVRRPVRSATAVRGAGGPATPGVQTQLCPEDPKKPLIAPEALSVMRVASDDPKAPSAHKLATGKGVRIAILADGFDIDDPEFVRPDGRHVVTDYKDVTGAGTAAPTPSFEGALDLSSTSAQGRVVRDLGDLGLPYLPKGCTIRVLGVAPDADVTAVKVLDADTSASLSWLVAGVDYAVTVAHADVVNESLLQHTYPDAPDDPWALANAAAVRAGATVVQLTGDSGEGNTLSSPGSSPGVLTLGATQTLRELVQSGTFSVPHPWRNDAISNLSGAGVAQTGRTVDAVAPGWLGWIICTPSPRFPDCTPAPGSTNGLNLGGGTSESAPLTAGVAALVIQAYRATHGGHSPSPALVGRIITGSAHDLGLPADEQGAGRVDALAAVLTARAVGLPSAKAASGGGLVAASTQVDLVRPAGRAVTVTTAVTNTGRTTRTVRPVLRGQVRTGGTTQTAGPLTPSGRYFLTNISVTVPPGVDEAKFYVTYPDTAGTSGWFADAFDPAGVLSSDASSQGPGSDNALVAVPHPRAGTWRIEFGTFAPADQTPYAGPVRLTSEFYRNTTVGTARPAQVRLAPGATARVRLTLPASSEPGAGTLVAAFRDAARGTVLTAVPVAVRTVVPLTQGRGSFAGVLHGGNGRQQGALAGTASYLVDVPKGAPSLGVHVAVPPSAGQVLRGVLVAPDGNAVDLQSNALFDGKGAVAAAGGSVDLTAARPRAGRWTVVFGIQGGITGTTAEIGYSGRVALTPPPVSVSGAPAGGTVRRGAPATATVHVVNDTASPKAYVVEGRLTKAVAVPLAEYGPPSQRLVPHFGEPSNAVLVPPGTTAVTTTARSTERIRVESAAYGGGVLGRQVLGTTGTTSVVRAAGAELTPTYWYQFASRVGVHGAAAAPSDGTATLTTTATTRGFDPAVTSSTGDPYLQALDAQAPTATPLILEPGEAGTITVTVTPGAAVGTKVAGTLEVRTFDRWDYNGGGLASFPYSYTVK